MLKAMERWVKAVRKPIQKLDLMLNCTPTGKIEVADDKLTVVSIHGSAPKEEGSQLWDDDVSLEAYVLPKSVQWPFFNAVYRDKKQKPAIGRNVLFRRMTSHSVARDEYIFKEMEEEMEE
jgi:hypothetical protein